MKTSYNELLKYAVLSDIVYDDLRSDEKGSIYEDTCTSTFNCNYVNNKYKLISYDTSDNVSGTQIMLFKDNKSGEYVLSIRGTELKSKEFQKDVIQADSRLSNGQVPVEQFLHIVKFIEKEVKPIVKDAPIVVTGHSLGGTEAELVGIANNGLNIKQIISYNSPSANSLVISSNIKSDGRTEIIKDYELNDDYFLIKTTINDIIVGSYLIEEKIEDKNILTWIKNYTQNQPDKDKFIAVRANDMISPIANLWGYERIGKLIEIPGISHSIDNVVDTLKTLAEIENGLKEKGYSQDEINNQLLYFTSKTINHLMHNFSADFIVYLAKMKIISNLHSEYAKPLTFDPLVLDLNNNCAIDTITLNNSKAFFDHNSDNIAYKSSWISKDDGLLVLDKNNNNLIDNGNELFGNFTEIPSSDFKALDTNNNQTLNPTQTTFALNGFEALKLLDSNKDGVIDINDKEFNNLKVWQDLNEDGITQINELKSLKDLNITSINLNYKDTNQNLDNDNTITQTATFIKDDKESLNILKPTKLKSA